MLFAGSGTSTSLSVIVVKEAGVASRSYSFPAYEAVRGLGGALVALGGSLVPSGSLVSLKGPLVFPKGPLCHTKSTAPGFP